MISVFGCIEFLSSVPKPDVLDIRYSDFKRLQSRFALKHYVGSSETWIAPDYCEFTSQYDSPSASSELSMSW